MTQPVLDSEQDTARAALEVRSAPAVAEAVAQALLDDFGQRSEPGGLAELDLRTLERELVAEAMRFVVAEAARQAELGDAVTGLRLFRPDGSRAFGRSSRLAAESSAALAARVRTLGAESVADVYESLLDLGLERDAAKPRWRSDRRRKATGSFYTPRAVTDQVVDRAFAALGHGRALGARSDLGELRVCDPAMGGGAFLIAAAREIARRIAGGEGAQPALRLRRELAERCLYGVDCDALAVAVAEAAIWLWVGDPSLDPGVLTRSLHHGDALLGQSFEPDRHQPVPGSFDWRRELPEIAARGGFDLMIGNPPWVAYAGRAAQPLEPERRAEYQRCFTCFRGYPTLHGLFVERVARLAPAGVVALVLPSPLSDLDGYLPVRRALAASHTPDEPLLELGQDAFERVVQPCFALVARPGRDPAGGDRTWRLQERQRAGSSAAEVAAPAVLERLTRRATLPRELFGEMGFQSAGEVSKKLFSRAGAPDARHVYPLLEGRDVGEFRQGPARLFLEPDPEVLAAARCRLRPQQDYARVRFVVRQTAKIPIAALHAGLPFRNTLLAGFDAPELAPETVVALLNSTLYRALHLALRRDARQAAFPQVKIKHLRALPMPPADAPRLEALAELTRRATADGLDTTRRAALDELVFDLFGLIPEERQAVTQFVDRRTGNRRAT